jgi:hypothetical protein
MKNIIMVIALCMLLFATCKNDSRKSSTSTMALNEECDDLKDEIDWLKRQNKVLIKCIARLVKDSMDDREHNLFPIDSNDIRKGIEEIKKDGKIDIPTALVFETAQLLDMLTHTNEEGCMADGIYAYPIEEKGILKIALVPYILNDANAKVLIESPFKAYNYSDMCPAHCPINNGVFNAESEFYQFKP